MKSLEGGSISSLSALPITEPTHPQPGSSPARLPPLHATLLSGAQKPEAAFQIVNLTMPF